MKRRRRGERETGPCRLLSDAPARRPVRVRSLDVEPQAARRLADLGLTVGASATVIGRTHRAVIIAVRGGRLAIGLTLADGVLVDADLIDAEPDAAA
jgi:Fe2+ transport system protein FeoA